MRVFAAVITCVLALAAPRALASMPCHLPGVTLRPGMNATNVESLELQVDFATAPDRSSYVWVEGPDGKKAAVDLDAGQFVIDTEIAGFPGPGWYRVHVAVDLDRSESWDRSMVAGKGELWADVLVGRSYPSVSRVVQCRTPSTAPTSTVTIFWSEPVTFATEPGSQLELFDDTGNPLSCGPRVPWPDGGYSGQPLSAVFLSCDGGDVASLLVLRAPRGADGGVVASFPTQGLLWEMTNWADEDCRYWQPELRRRGHRNVSVTGLETSYAKCDLGGCGCGAESAVPLLAGVVLLLVRARRRSPRAGSST